MQRAKLTLAVLATAGLTLGAALTLPSSYYEQTNRNARAQGACE